MKGKIMTRAYGFDEVAIVPGRSSIDPDDVDISGKIGNVVLEIPFLASAMDGVVDENFAAKMGKMGGIAVLNLEGVYTRYSDPKEVLDEIITARPDEVTALIQKIYQEPIKKKLVKKVIETIKSENVPVCVSSTPLRAEDLGEISKNAGADLFCLQVTVLTKHHSSTKNNVLNLERFIKKMEIPIIAGNCVTYEVAYDLMEVGASAILVGVGPGAACTTRGVLGIGVPQVTATMDCALARDEFLKKTKRYVSIITDGGMTHGADIAKAFASGADMVMFGNAFAKAKEAPGRGYHWGMALPHPYLPRGTRIHVGISGSLEEILFGPAKTDDGTQNLVGALKLALSYCGAKNIKEFRRKARMIIAPQIKTEGKIYQKAQKVGMGK
ncbi:MAG: GuaB3 family IMP dehydrogenase-related protein [Elusimicrobia bacterium]|nr:GuaB3 family IMP dehydrogenase-related protein [Elusimicrobiota bacterium]